ncbi:hypothetical protein [Streptomyces tendae]
MARRRQPHSARDRGHRHARADRSDRGAGAVAFQPLGLDAGAFLKEHVLLGGDQP